MQFNAAAAAAPRGRRPHHINLVGGRSCSGRVHQSDRNRMRKFLLLRTGTREPVQEPSFRGRRAGSDSENKMTVITKSMEADE